MIIFAIYHHDFGFIGLYASVDCAKSFSREFVDVVICNGQENACDDIAQRAGYEFNCTLTNIMNWHGWERQRPLDMQDQTFSYYAFKASL